MSPYRKLTETGVGEARWTHGFWAERFELCKEVTIPNMWEAMHDPENAALFTNFYVAAGLQEGTHRGTNWSDGDCYKWLEAVTHVYGVTRDPELDRRLDELIEIIARAQDPDGYICTQIQLNPTKERWQLRRHHELYNMGHLMTAASVHHRVTGKDNFLSVAKKLADYLYDVFQPRPPELAHYGWNPSNIMGLMDLYRETEEERYLELAGIFVDMRGSQPWTGSPFREPTHREPRPGDQNQDRVQLRKETEAVGHAVTATYLYAGAADVYAETGESALLEALERIWRDVTDRKMYITGGVAALHHGTSIRHDAVHEAFGAAYQLPNATAYNETCANIGNAMWNWRLLNITGEAKYADVMELVIYNSGLSPMSLDGKQFFYTNPLRWYGKEHSLLSNDAHERWFTFKCYCCPPQVARTIARMQDWAYGLSDEGIWVHLYGSNQLQTTLPDGAPVKLTQKTDYPWDGRILITVEETPERPWALMLRIPGWTRYASLRVNGETVAATPETYARLKRTWSPGDTVELGLPMKPRLVKSNPKVEETRNQVAVMRGPLVYCLESTDLPDGVSVFDVCLARTVILREIRDPEQFGNMVLLDGVAFRSREEKTDRLYQMLERDSAVPLRVLLIPYYAWNNRGEPEMSVWLPRC